MTCESKKISELTEACLVNSNDILPIVQDGTNKYVKVKDLLKGNCGDDTQDDCCCSKALSKAVTALDFSRTAMDLANKAFDKACQVDTKLGALEQRVTELELIICNIQSQITQIFNRFDQLEDGLTVTVVTTSETTLDKHEIKLGGITKGIIQVLRPTSNINQSGLGLPADAWQVRLALDGLKSEVTKNLTFVSGKFNSSGLTYNGTSPVSVNIPTALSLLDNDGNFLEGVRGHDGNLVQVVNHIAELGPLPTATSTILGGVKIGYSQSGKKYPVKLDSSNKAYVDLTGLPTAENLDDLGDVDLTSPLNGDILYYDRTKWINVPFEDLIGQNCEAIKACFSTENFNVAPLVVTLKYNERVANFAVTSSGAWKIQKVTSGDNVFTASILDNVHLNPGTNLPLIITANSDNTTGQDREVEWDVIPWITVPGLIETQRIKVILKAQTAPTNRTITYNISGGQTNSIKVNNEVVGNGGQKTAPDGSNYSVPIVSNDSGYRIKTVTPSAGTYSNGTLTINPITSDVIVEVVLEEIPAGTHKVTYVVDGDATKITNLPNSPVTVTNGLSYTYTPTIELGYEIPTTNGVTFNPTGNGNYDGTTITIPQGVTTDTTVIIKVIAEGLAVLTVTPTSIEIEPEGTTDPEEITVSTTCTTSGITINTENLPTGITATLNSAQTLINVEVDSSVAAGDYTFTVSDNCGNTETVTITKKEETPAYFDEDTNNFAFFSPKGIPVDGNDNPPSVAPDPSDPSTCWEHWNHSRDGLRDNYTYDNGVVTYIDSSDNSWNITVPYSDGILYLSIYWLSEYITDGNDVTNPTVVSLIQMGGTPTSVTASLSEDSNNGTITLKLLLTGTVYPTDLTTSNVHPININNFSSGDKSRASYAISSGLRVRISDSAPNVNGYPVIEGSGGYHYLIDTKIELDNYLYSGPNSVTSNVSTEGSTDVRFELPRTLPEDEFNFVLDTQNTSPWISNVRFNNDRTSYGPVIGVFDTSAGSAETGTLAFSLNWTNPSPGHENYTLTVNRQ